MHATIDFQERKGVECFVLHVFVNTLHNDISIIKKHAPLHRAD